ncbi:MAG: hypothetical protein ACTSRS_23080 [Candidatus Helarchaeota archaeon]
MRCATCGAELIEVGFPKEGFQEYRCPNGCEEIFSLRVKVANAILCAIFVVVLLATTILVLPIWTYFKINAQLTTLNLARDFSNLRSACVRAFIFVLSALKQKSKIKLPKKLEATTSLNSANEAI